MKRKKTQKEIPKISIITPSYNQGKYLEQNILSVLGQGYKSFEHIIIDGGSRDSTLKILKKYPHLKWVSEEDEGQSDAFNKGLAMASGDIVGWINSDDYLEKNALAQVAKNFGQNTKWVVGNTAVEYRSLKKKIYRQTARIDFRSLTHNPAITRQPGTFFKIEFLKKLGGLDKKLHFAMDFDLFLRASKITPPKMVNKYFACFTFHNDGQKTSGANTFANLSTLAAIYKKNRVAIVYLSGYALKSFWYYAKYLIKIALIKMGFVSKKYYNASFFNKKLR